MPDEEAIRRQVANRLRRQLNPTSRPIIDAEEVNAVPEGGALNVPPGAIVTPLAQTAALDRRVTLVADSGSTSAPSDGKTVALGADHGGYALKETLKTFLQTEYTVIDCGTHGPESVDYPDFALAVAELVSGGRAWRGIGWTVQDRLVHGGEQGAWRPGCLVL
jgi:hypothetical protein